MGLSGLVLFPIEEHAAEDEMRADVIGVQAQRGIEQRLRLGKLVMIETQCGEVIQQCGVAVIKFQRLSKEFSGARMLLRCWALALAAR